MAAPFRDWTLEDATEAVSDALAEKIDEADYLVNALFIEDRDHFQSGTQWVGPWGENDAAKALILNKVEPKFCPIDVLSEVLDRHVSALLKTEADVQIVSRDPLPVPGSDASEAEVTAHENAEKALAEQTAPIRDALAAWWDRVKLWPLARTATTRSRWSGRGVLRLWLPKGRLDVATGQNEKGEAVEVPSLPSGLDLPSALARLELSAPTPKEAAVVVDPDTQERAAIFLYTVDDAQFAEVWFVDEAGRTVVRILSESAAAVEFPMETGGRLPLAEMEAALLVTEPVRRLQNQLNFFQSLLGRTAETAGFPERYISGASPEGTWTSVNPGEGNYVETRQQGETTFYLVPTGRTLGAGTTVELRGIVYDANDAGGKAITTPSVQRFEPTNPAFVIACIDATYATLLRQCKQAHVTKNSAADQSGEGQQQARADFEADLLATKPAVEGMLRDILEAALAFAGAMGAEAGLLDRYRVVVNLHVDSGPISADEVRVLAEQVSAGLLSQETALTRMNVEDVGAELERIRSSPEGRARLSQVQAVAVKAWTDAGAKLEKAGELVGMTADEVKLLQEAVQPPNPADRVNGVVGVIGQ